MQPLPPGTTRPLTADDLQAVSVEATTLLGNADDVEQGTRFVEVPGFAPLAELTLLKEDAEVPPPFHRRYRIDTVLSSSARLNAYEVSDLGARICPSCGGYNGLAATHCDECGMAIDGGVPVEHPVLLLRDTNDPDLLAHEVRLAQLGVTHPHMLNVRDTFTDQPYGDTPRHFVVSDPERGAGLSTMPRPQPEISVLIWGRQLAGALAALHAHRLVHGQVRPENIRIVGSHAYLTNFARTEELPPLADGVDLAERCSGDVTALAGALSEVLDLSNLAPETTALLRQVGTQPSGAPPLSAAVLAVELHRVIEGLRRPRSVLLQTGRAWDVGQVRELNEDSLLAIELDQVQLSQDRPLRLYAVADGMGGHAAGEVASRTALDTLAEAILPRLAALSATRPGDPAPDLEAALVDACQRANQAVYERGRANRSDMGTTLVAALVVGQRALIAHIGDSRAYHIRGNQVVFRTADHSMVAQLVAAGKISEADARAHPQRNLVYRVVGDKPQVEVATDALELAVGDWLILCSDGLNGMIEDADIVAATGSGENPQAVAEALVWRANQAGGEDNVTVIAGRLTELRSRGDQAP